MEIHGMEYHDKKDKEAIIQGRREVKIMSSLTAEPLSPRSPLSPEEPGSPWEIKGQAWHDKEGKLNFFKCIYTYTNILLKYRPKPKN